MKVTCRESQYNPLYGLYHYTTVVGETLAVFRLPQIRKNGQCLDGQVGKTFLEIFGGNYNFSNVLSENLGLGF